MKKPKPQYHQLGANCHMTDGGDEIEILQIIQARDVNAVYSKGDPVRVVCWALVKWRAAGDEGQVFKYVDVKGMILQEGNDDLVFASACDGFKEYEYD